MYPGIRGRHSIANEEEGEMRSMIGRFEEYLDEKRLTLNYYKTKIIRFQKGGGRIKRVDWRWKRKRIEEVKEFGYIGYTLQKNGARRHMLERELEEWR